MHVVTIAATFTVMPTVPASMKSSFSVSVTLAPSCPSSSDIPPMVDVQSASGTCAARKMPSTAMSTPNREGSNPPRSVNARDCLQHTETHRTATHPMAIEMLAHPKPTNTSSSCTEGTGLLVGNWVVVLRAARGVVETKARRSQTT